MAKRVTTDDIKLINEIYYRTKSYAETARQTGWSANTVSRYVDKSFTPVAATNVKRVTISDVPEFDTSIFANVENYGDLCVLSADEQNDIKELWKEISI